jgi:hypothetical protein
MKYHRLKFDLLSTNREEKEHKTYMFCHSKVSKLYTAIRINQYICAFDVPENLGRE